MLYCTCTVLYATLWSPPGLTSSLQRSQEPRNANTLPAVSLVDINERLWGQLRQPSPTSSPVYYQA